MPPIDCEYESVIKSVRPVHLLVLFPGIDHGYAASLVRGKRKIQPYLQRLVVRELTEAKAAGLLDEIDKARPPRSVSDGSARARQKTTIKTRKRVSAPKR